MNIGVIGTSLTARGWAIAFARAGYDVRLQSDDRVALQTAFANIAVTLEDLEKYDGLHGCPASEVAARIRPVDDLERAVEDAGYIQDSTEGSEAKKRTFERLDALAPNDAILASSNVGILPSSFAEELQCRDRVLLAHPINPALLPIVEVAACRWTERSIVGRTVLLMREIGLKPHVLPESSGMVIDRIAAAVIHECFRLVAGGYATVDDIDSCVRDGLARRWVIAGPFETMHVNTAGGIAAYIRAAEPLFQDIFGKLQSFSVPWAGELGDLVEQQLRQRLAAESISHRSAWRDRELARLDKFKRAATD